MTVPLSSRCTVIVKPPTDGVQPYRCKAREGGICCVHIANRKKHKARKAVTRSTMRPPR
jgi:hypothetical protein